ncbi:MAG: hypothetical protein ACREO5_01830 [Candidatus Binatia bacterium]
MISALQRESSAFKALLLTLCSFSTNIDATEFQELLFRREFLPLRSRQAKKRMRVQPKGGDEDE